MVVVTGATGHIGNVLVRELLSVGEQVRVMVPPMESIRSIEKLDIEIVYGDLRDQESLRRCFLGAEKVFHLAGVVYIGSGRKKLLQEINVSGTQNVIEACLSAGVGRLIYTSSIHAFEEPPKGVPILESKEFDPDRVMGGYAKTKAAATRAVLDAVREHGLDAVIVHPTGVIGPYEFKLSNMGQLVFDFMRGRMKAYVDGGYDFVDVRDVARGMVLAAEKGVSGENYILSGEHITVKRLMELLEKETGIRAPRFKLPVWFARATGIFAELYYKMVKQQPLFTAYSVATLSSNSLTSHQKAAQQLGYTVRSVHESIRDSVQWFRENLLKKQS